jgi:very-short-patch-repair endonuclease
VEEDGVLITSVKQCEYCGYLHPERDDNGPDLCERCQRPLTKVLRELFRLQNVSTKRREKINSDEEERLRLGYDLKTGFRFAHINGHPCCCVATVKKDEKELAKLTYGHAATLYRINLGWTRRKNKDQLGYVLDLERGYWAVNEQTKESDEDDPLSVSTRRVIPYVEDRRNCLIFEPQGDLNQITITSLQSALKNAIQVKYQLEDNELAAESLPDSDNRRLVLFYESAEGGAGVLRRLIDDPNAMAAVAREALRLCHFDPDTGSDLRRAPGTKEDCEAACYNCIMNYSNQRDHKLLDRQAIRDILLDFASAKVEASPTELPRSEHMDRLMRQADTGLEREWLQYLNGRNLNLPSHAQKYMKVCNTRPDFFYENHRAAIYVDGPIHKYPDRRKRDEKQIECMEDHGYTVIRFGSDDDWDSEINKYPNIFGGS